jgi:hypothetical protein
VLGSGELDDLAAFRLDRLLRLLFLLHMQLALERDRLRNGIAHGALQIDWPRVERCAMQEDRA